MEKFDCLVVDDEEALANAVCDYFNLFEVKTHVITDGKECLKFLNNNEVKLILLDINLGENSGFLLCKEIRRIYNIPIFFISARNTDDDVLLALNIGGDDYVNKPFSLNILLAKVKATLRRYSNLGEDVVDHGNFRIDNNKIKIYKDGIALDLKTMEFKLLSYLIINAGKVVTKKELFDKVWGDSFFSDGTLNVHIRRIREKIEANPNEPEFIKTVWGVGYCFYL